MTVYNDMFNHMDGVMWALAKNRTQWKKDLFFAKKLVQQKVSKYYVEVTLSMGMHLISARILYPFGKLRSFRKWESGMDINPDDETSYSTQYQKVVVMDVENENCAKHRHLPVNKPESITSCNLVPSAAASRSGQSFFDRYDVCSNDEEYLTSDSVSEMRPSRSDCAVPLLRAARLHFNSLPEAPKNLVQIIPNLNDYHSDPMEMNSIFWIPNITDWWHQQEDMHLK